MPALFYFVSYFVRERSRRRWSSTDGCNATMSDDSDNDQGLDMFTEPDGFYEPDKEPTFVTHRMLNEHELTLRLVGHNPLWVGAASCLESSKLDVLIAKHAVPFSHPQYSLAALSPASTNDVLPQRATISGMLDVH